MNKALLKRLAQVAPEAAVDAAARILIDLIAEKVKAVNAK